MDLLEKPGLIKADNTVDSIIRHIRNSIVIGRIKPGDRLPSERQLCEQFGVGRTTIRAAIKKLEVFGILKTNPQSGSVVLGIDLAAMEGLLTNVIRLENNEFSQLVETRVLMETYACRQAALRRKTSDIDELEQALDRYRGVVENNKTGVHEDFSFHLKIAEASQNQVIRSLLLIIIPDIIKIYRELNVCGAGRFRKSLDEHVVILECIVRQRAEDAEAAMRMHLKDVMEFSRNYSPELNQNNQI
ncbi:MAG: FadR family transcriptional regulator [Bacteroidales bacterium]|nr:FadR family transcriptional regulator [Bacteroidales bacterium]